MRKTPFFFLGVLMLLAACSAPPDNAQTGQADVNQAVSTAVAQTLQAKPSPTPAPSQTPASPTTAPPPASCLEISEPRAIKTVKGQRTTISAQEFKGYLALMGIEQLCIPPALGAPYLNADWDSAKMPATGRMLSIGFDNPYPGMGWGGVFLLYSTYDFKVGSEYDIFARVEDREAVRRGSMAGSITAGGAKGFMRIHRSQLCMGKCEVYKTAIFPFDKFYVALVADMGSFDAETDWDNIIPRVQAGDIPTDRKPAAQALDLLLQGIHFRPE